MLLVVLTLYRYWLVVLYGLGLFVRVVIRGKVVPPFSLEEFLKGDKISRYGKMLYENPSFINLLIK